MKIWGEVPKVSSIYDNKKGLKSVEKTSGVSSKQDVVSISGQAKDYQTVMKALKDVPDIRKDKVEELRDKYESDDYKVSGDDIVDKLIKSFKEEKA